MQCYIVEKGKEWGTTLAFQIPNGTRASSSGLFASSSSSGLLIVYTCLQHFYSLKYIISLSCCTAQYLHPHYKINQLLELPEYSTEAKNLFT